MLKIIKFYQNLYMNVVRHLLYWMLALIREAILYNKCSAHYNGHTGTVLGPVGHIYDTWNKYQIPFTNPRWPGSDRHKLSVTKTHCVWHTQLGCVRPRLSETDTYCPKQTPTICDRQLMAVTDKDCLDRHIQLNFR